MSHVKTRKAKTHRSPRAKSCPRPGPVRGVAIALLKPIDETIGRILHGAGLPSANAFTQTRAILGDQSAKRKWTDPDEARKMVNLAFQVAKGEDAARRIVADLAESTKDELLGKVIPGYDKRAPGLIERVIDDTEHRLSRLVVGARKIRHKPCPA